LVKNLKSGQKEAKLEFWTRLSCW